MASRLRQAPAILIAWRCERALVQAAMLLAVDSDVFTDQGQHPGRGVRAGVSLLLPAGAHLLHRCRPAHQGTGF